MIHTTVLKIAGNQLLATELTRVLKDLVNTPESREVFNVLRVGAINWVGTSQRDGVATELAQKYFGAKIYIEQEGIDSVNLRIAFQDLEGEKFVTFSLPDISKLKIKTYHAYGIVHIRLFGKGGVNMLGAMKPANSLSPVPFCYSGESWSLQLILSPDEQGPLSLGLKLKGGELGDTR